MKRFKEWLSWLLTGRLSDKQIKKLTGMSDEQWNREVDSEDTVTS